MSLDSSVFGWVSMSLSVVIVPLVVWFWNHLVGRIRHLEGCKHEIILNITSLNNQMGAVQKDYEHLAQTRTNPEQVREIFRMEIEKLEKSIDEIKATNDKIFTKIDGLYSQMATRGIVERRDL